MRLPAITVRQAQRETRGSSREPLPRLPAAQAGRVFIEVPQTYAAAYAKNLRDALHRFWVKPGIGCGASAMWRRVVLPVDPAGRGRERPHEDDERRKQRKCPRAWGAM
jgi:hypothetical protein